MTATLLIMVCTLTAICNNMASINLCM